MPIYEYRCVKCGNLTEVLQKFSDLPIAECELCQGKMKKLISQSTFHLKGTGWYVTDYASNAASATKSAEKEGRTSTGEVQSSGIEAKSSTENSGKTKDSCEKVSSNSSGNDKQ